MNPMHYFLQKISNRNDFFVHTDGTMKLKKGHNSRNNWCILSLIELDLYFMIVYLCIKYESKTLIFSKDIERKPFFVCTDGTYELTDVPTYEQW